MLSIIQNFGIDIRSYLEALYFPLSKKLMVYKSYNHNKIAARGP